MSRVLRLSEDDYKALLARGKAGKPTPLAHLSPNAASAILARSRPISKYRNQRTEVGGIKFASKREARRYQELKTLEASGMITALALQVRYPLTVGDIKVGTYVADFVYRKATKMEFTYAYDTVVEDVKSPPTMTPLYKLKKKLMFAIHGIKITEV